MDSGICSIRAESETSGHEAQSYHVCGGGLDLPRLGGHRPLFARDADRAVHRGRRVFFLEEPSETP